MLKDMEAIEENETWGLVDSLLRYWHIRRKWVYKVKSATSAATLPSTRCGSSQKASCRGRASNLAPVAAKNCNIHHMDVKSAFLNGELAEVVYVKQPPGCSSGGKEHKVLRLRKALYGLQQAPRAWNIKLDTALGSIGFTKCTTEHANYMQQWGRSTSLSACTWMT